MKKRNILFTIALMILAVCMILPSCSKKPQDLESYLQKDEDAMNQIKDVSDQSGLDLSISGNDLIYTYDISTIEGVTEEIATDDLMVSTLTNALNAAAANFVNLCKELEEESGISGIKIKVYYTYKDKELVYREFTSSDVVSEQPSGNTEDAADAAEEGAEEVTDSAEESAEKSE